MANGGFASELARKVRTQSGQEVYIHKTITSSAVTTSAQALTQTATGKFWIKEIIVKTDATGLAGGTNFEILSNNAKGVVNIFVETVANLGANITKVMSGGGISADTTTSDARPSVTALPTVLEAGKAIQYKMTASAGTGAGTIDIFVCLVRIDEGAQCLPV